MQIGDVVVFLYLPRHGAWSIARVPGGYRYEISAQGNAVDGTPDQGHIRDVELLTDSRGVDPAREGISDGLGRSMRPVGRMWSLDAHGDEIERLLQQHWIRGRPSFFMAGTVHWRCNAAASITFYDRATNGKSPAHQAVAQSGHRGASQR